MTQPSATDLQRAAEWLDENFPNSAVERREYVAPSLAGLIAESREQERERCAKLVQPYPSELRLMAGEMSTQEMRTLEAVLNAMVRKIRSLGDR